MINSILDLKTFFEKGESLNVRYRVAQLKKLQAAIKSREKEIETALQKDLGKHPAESYASEIGFIYEEIKYAINNLFTWTETQKSSGNIGLFPTVNMVYAQPKGIALIIAPWNYPIQLVFAPLIAAIAAGCVCIVKPSEDAKESEKVILNIITSTFAPNYICCVTGIGADLIPPIIKSGFVNHVFFTGSTRVGKQIALLCAEQLISYTLELGGKSPTIVHPSANIKISAKRIAWGKFFNAGQTCVAPDYVLIHHSIKNAFILEIKQAITDFYGPNAKFNNSYGKIINKRRFNELTEYLKSNSENIIFGGEFDEKSLYISPTIIEKVSLENDIMKNEIFGPILPIIEFTKIDEIYSTVTKSPSPLSLYIFSNDRNFDKEIIERISFGGGCVNNTLVHLLSSEIPFGGVGKSGQGNYHGKAGFDAFTHYKSIAKTGTWFDLDLKYPPYSKLKYKLFKWLLG